MRDSASGMVAAVAVVLCCALPILLLSGIAATGGGLAINQQGLIGLGLLLLVLVAVTLLFVRRRNR